ncbi:C-type lectin domain family 4 member G-like isoform X2 [Cyprinodon tularosa]|uniref:C-type lectin domain family 4 member G-like isoform X2 n=1 Tax=Cyprinodon tularosa TaxID=77115 RepID=UPI0018E250BC|nr:C-type lectin domain family 4 member G-like isoform X2 [Cyprinodon tularosa]
MEEDEVQYASVVIKSKRPPRAKIEEDVVYSEVKIRNQTAPQTPNTNVSAGLVSDKKAERRYRQYKKYLCCFGSLCLILVLAIIGICLYFIFLQKRAEQELKLLKDEQTILLGENDNLKQEKNNLTNLNNKLSSDLKNLTNLNDKLSSDFNNTVQNLTNLNNKLNNKVQNLTNLNNKLNNKVQNLTKQNANLTQELYQVKKENQELETESKNLTEQIETMEKTWNEKNVSRAQWSIDNYCPRENNERKCKSCPKGWMNNGSSCFAINNAESKDWKTWEEAQKDCRGKGSDLAVVGDEAEKKFVTDESWTGNDIKGYWIGLRAVDGKWKWINGSDLTIQSWIKKLPNEATDQCVTSHQSDEWSSKSCNEKNAWICGKKAISV